MATVYVSMAPTGIRGVGSTVEIMRGGEIRSETITSSATSAQGALRANGNEVAQVYCDTAVYVASGESATVSATTGLYVPAGQLAFIGVADNDLVAVIDA